MAAQIIASTVVVSAVVLIRVVAGRLVRRQDWVSIDERRRWLVMARNATFVVGIFGLVLVWAEELQVIGLSLVAIAVAVVISTQDLIRSVMASLQRATSGSFSIGDRIKVGEFQGYVVDHALLVTTLLEIGPTRARTGRTLSIPNHYFLTHPVANETAGHQYILHTFEVPVARSEWRQARATLQQAALEASDPYVEDAREEMASRALRHSLPLPIVAADVFAAPTAAEVVTLTVRVPVAAPVAGSVERQITDRWLESAD